MFLDMDIGWKSYIPEDRSVRNSLKITSTGGAKRWNKSNVNIRFQK